MITSPMCSLYWLRESGCDAGTPVNVGDLPAPLRDRIGSLCPPDRFNLRLPFFDRREERMQEELLGKLEFELAGDTIRAILPLPAATRDMAATCALADPVWHDLPNERDPEYFALWRNVSVGLQHWLRQNIAHTYFQDAARYRDRDSAYPVLLYQAARPFLGRPRTDLTYDLRDFPWCNDTLTSSWRLVGRRLQRVMTTVERRLIESGQTALAHHYAPVWHQDVLLAVRRKPKEYVDLLAREAAVINAVIDLGTQRSVDTINRSARTINQQLRKVHGCDMRTLGFGVFEEATRLLASRGSDRAYDFIDAWPDEDTRMGAAGRPDLRVAV
jgi:hypothetical protein